MSKTKKLSGEIIRLEIDIDDGNFYRIVELFDKGVILDFRKSERPDQKVTWLFAAE
jgi:hypothetical protein